MKVLLHHIAHARSGDKGNRLNIGVFAYEAAFWPILVEQLTADRVRAVYQHRGVSRVDRYVLEKIHGLNFVIDDLLEGGVNASLNVDGHGKTNSFRLLGIDIELPDHLAPVLSRRRNPSP